MANGVLLPVAFVLFSFLQLRSPTDLHSIPKITQQAVKSFWFYLSHGILNVSVELLPVTAFIHLTSPSLWAGFVPQETLSLIVFTFSLLLLQNVVMILLLSSIQIRQVRNIPFKTLSLEHLFSEDTTTGGLHKSSTQEILNLLIFFFFFTSSVL